MGFLLEINFVFRACTCLSFLCNYWFRFLTYEYRAENQCLPCSVKTLFRSGVGGSSAIYVIGY